MNSLLQDMGPLLKGYMNKIQNQQLPSLGNTKQVSTIPRLAIARGSYSPRKDLRSGGGIDDLAAISALSSAPRPKEQTVFVWYVGCLKGN